MKAFQSAAGLGVFPGLYCLLWNEIRPSRLKDHGISLLNGSENLKNYRSADSKYEVVSGSSGADFEGSVPFT